jgi:hypothetical protein
MRSNEKRRRTFIRRRSPIFGRPRPSGGDRAPPTGAVRGAHSAEAEQHQGPRRWFGNRERRGVGERTEVVEVVPGRGTAWAVVEIETSVVGFAMAGETPIGRDAVAAVIIEIDDIVLTGCEGDSAGVDGDRLEPTGARSRHRRAGIQRRSARPLGAISAGDGTVPRVDLGDESRRRIIVHFEREARQRSAGSGEDLAIGVGGAAAPRIDAARTIPVSEGGDGIGVGGGCQAERGKAGD